MPTTTLDPDSLELEAARRGLSLTAVFGLAGISSKTQAKVSRGEPVRPSIAGRLEEVLKGLPLLESVTIREVAG